MNFSTFLRLRVKRLFYHAYDSYLKYAYPFDELRPLSCDGHDTWGSFSLTLVDALDTLVIMGNHSEFRRAARMLLDHLNADKNVNVSVFETNIRGLRSKFIDIYSLPIVVGGLISAHLLSKRANFEVEPSWPCSGPLLRKAEVFAAKLLPAFDTPTGMPYGTVNLGSGSVPPGETPVTCVAGIGTFILEFGTLSRLTGDPRYEAAAMRALKALWRYRSSLGLLGNHIDTLTGKWKGSESTIGAGVDSFFEYLVKGAALFRLPELDAMFREYKVAIEKHIQHGDWNLMVNKDSGTVAMAVFQSLEAFWPGLLTLTGDIDGALRHLTAYHEIWRKYGFIPEFYSLSDQKPVTTHSAYPLRPELIESIFYVYRATMDQSLLEMGVDILTSIETVARTECGFATVADVVSHTLENRMESFFLAETTKYLYLLFDTDNFINKIPGDIPPPEGSRLTSGLHCYPETGGYIFNTEAHPIDPGVLNCCYAPKLDENDQIYDAETLLSNESFDLITKSDLEDLPPNDLAMTTESGTLDDLLKLVDSTFEKNLEQLIPTQDDENANPYDHIKDKTSSICMNPRTTDASLIGSWSEFRSVVTSAFQSKSVQYVHTFTNLSTFEPALLTCGYPPFHRRLTFAGQLMTPVN